ALRTLLAQPRAWKGVIDDQNLGRHELERIASDKTLHYLLHPPRVAIVGAPNVGKSTLANQLFAQERSITADLPGTTRDWVGEIANLDGLAVMLIDTPGHRETHDPIERESIARSRGEIESADIVVLVMDLSQKSGVDPTMLKNFPGAILVRNKSDLPSVVAFDSKCSTIETVATIGIGIDDLRKAIRKKLGCDDIDPTR